MERYSIISDLVFLIKKSFTEKDKIRYSSLGESLIAISKYYFRDTRIFELYILVKYLRKKFFKSKVHLDRTRLEVDHLRIFKTPNNNNWRNAFITLSGIEL